jgi:ferredoxin
MKAGDKMVEDVYEILADALDKLPNAFPRTKAKTEIAILRKIFSPKEAAIASQLSIKVEPVDVIAKRSGMPINDYVKMITAMAWKGMVLYEDVNGKPHFRLAPFIVGVYESQVDRMDHELAHLVEKYLADGGLAGIMKPQPAIHRVVPAQNSVKSEWILPYDDVREMLIGAKTFRVRKCICRVQQEHIGRKCKFPLESCINFSSEEHIPSQKEKGPDRYLSKEEALALLAKTEEIGLVHTVSNVRKGVGYICNCCSCCCGILRGVTEFGIQNSVAQANYFAAIDPSECLGCGTCIERCQMHAISDKDGVATVDRSKCIGCGLCVTGCPNKVAKLQRKPNSEIKDPPSDYEAWEQDRLRNRGLIG